MEPEVADGLQTIESCCGDITTRLEEMPPEALARMLLSEMIAGVHEPGPVEGLTGAHGAA